MASDYLNTVMTQSQRATDLTQLINGPQAGTIIRIQMKNFMCHDNLEVKLNPRINFICGKNGSGKSAIQTAVAVGLGGKALATNRGSAMRNLIKNDKNSCTITIDLVNEGFLAYKPEVYGSRIQVERHFTQSTSGYKIKDASGKLVSSEKKELDRIVAQFNIQYDNPICILHQDVARNFLNSSDPKTKYKFYLKATRFDEINRLAQESALRTKSVKDFLANKYETVEEIFKDVIQMKKKMKVIEEAKKQEKQCDQLKNEMVWAKINEKKSKLEQLQNKRQVEESSKTKVEKRMKDGEEADLKERLKGLEEKIKELDESVKEAKDNLQPAREDYRKKKDDLSRMLRDCHEAHLSAVRAKNQHNSCLKEIENFNKAPVDVAKELTFGKIENTLQKCRRKTSPPLPTSAQHYAEMLELEEWSQRFAKTKGGKLFFRGNTVAAGTSNLVFLSENFEELVSSCSEFHIDRTFKTVPSVNGLKQLLVVMAVTFNHAFPVCFVLMEKRKIESYRAVFQFMKGVVPFTNINHVITDFEKAILRAVREEFPDVDISGCWWHYSNCIMMRVKYLSLVPLVRRDLNVKKIMHMCMGLALLTPERIADGLGEVRLFANEVGMVADDRQRLNSLFAYIQTQWIEKVGVDRLSVFNSARRTNNDSESFNMILQREIGQAHPNAWKFIGHLQNIEQTMFTNLERCRNGLPLTRHKQRKSLIKDTTIRTASENLEANRLTVSEFLQTVAAVIGRRRIENGAYQSDESEEEDNDLGRPPSPLFIDPLHVDLRNEVDHPPDYIGPDLSNYRLQKTVLLQLHNLMYCSPQDFVHQQIEELKVDLLDREPEVEDGSETQQICTHCLTNKATRVSVPCGHWAGCITCCVRNQEEINRRKEKLMREINDGKSSLERVSSAQDMVRHEIQQFRDTFEKHKNTLQALRQRMADVNRQISKANDQFKNLTENADSLAIYGNLMVRIVEEVERSANKFEKKPIGPIGKYIKVKDPKWTGAVENYLTKNFLSTFCVDNTKDAQVLGNIFKTVCRGQSSSQPAIICSKFLNQMHNIRGSETGNERYRSLSQVLQFENPVVANCLIDQNEIESVLLIPTNEEAYHLLDEQYKVPKNCKKAFTLTGDFFVPAPNYKSYSSNHPVTHATLLQTKQEDVMRQLKKDIHKFTEEKAVVEAEQSQIQKEIQKVIDTINKNENQLKTLKNEKQKCLNKLNELRESVDPENHTDATWLATESQELLSKSEQEQDKHQELLEKCSELKEASENAKKRLEMLNSKIAESDKEAEPVKRKIQELRSTIHEVVNKSNLMRQKLKEHSEKLSEFDSQISELTEDINENTESASQVCDPIPTRRSSEVINQELKRIQQYLTKVREEYGENWNDLRKKLDERQETFTVVQQELHLLKNLILGTCTSLANRKSEEKKLQELLIHSARNNFQMYLNERQFEGKLEFDLEKGSLEIKVKPHKAEATGAKQVDTSSLSGGEKSFSTVCFILALWQEATLPFHFLDEFDVFMDGINRRIVMDMLIYYAKDVNRQFVFLTPLDMPSPEVDDNLITVHRLQAPRE